MVTLLTRHYRRKKQRMLFAPVNHALYGKAYAINVAREDGWNFEARNIIDGWANPNPAFNTCLATEQVMKPWYMVMLPYVISVSNISIQNNNLDTQDPWSALLQNEFTIYVLDVIKLTSGVVNVDLIKDGICANVTNGLSPGGSTSYSQTFSCDQIGRLVVVSGYSTDPQSLSICEIAIYGKYIGEVAGMSLYPNIFTGIFRSVDVPVFLNGTVLFKGDQLRVLEEGILMGWKYLLGAEGTVCLQIWRPVEYNPTEYRLLYSKLVSGKPGFYWLDVSSEHFPVYHDDLVGVSFLGGPPVPLYGIYNCEYFTVSGRLVVGDMVYYNEDYITELDRVATFTEYTICLDYFIQAIVRYNACQVHTCINGGTCIEKWDAQPQNSFECQCLPGYRGTYCQHNIDMCRNNTCLNGGTCVDDILLLTRCVCTEGFTGKMCEIPTESASSTESEEDDTETEAMTVTVTEFLTKADVLSLPIVTCDGGHGKFVLVPTEFGVSEGSMSCYYRRSTTHCASLCLQMTYTCNVYLFSELSGECCTLKTGELYHVKQGEFQTYYLIGCV